MECPFKVGDRVRVKAGLNPYLRKDSHRNGVVHDVRDSSWSFPMPGGAITTFISWRITIRREGHRDYTAYVGHDRLAEWDWEVVPLSDWTADETLVALAKAVLAHDHTAWRPFIDRALEILSEIPTK